MIQFNTLYNISAGIYFAFHNKNTKEKSYGVNHSANKKQKVKEWFPIYKFENMTKENYIIHCLYTNFKYPTTSYRKTIDKMADIPKKETALFKEEIYHYKKYLKEDIQKLIDEGVTLDIQSTIDRYWRKEIKWYTLYFIIMSISKDGLNDSIIQKSRVNKKIIYNIEKLLLYVSFSEDTIQKVKNIIITNNLI